MPAPPTDRELADVVEVVRAAGRAIEAVRAGGFAVHRKDDDSPLTQADRASDRLLRETLPRIVRAAWLSEETEDDPARLGAERVWIVDPLDGTKEFVEGVPQYAVSAGLVDGEGPLLAVIHHPPSGDVVAAVRGGGSSRNGLPCRVREGRVLGASRSEEKRGEFDPFRARWDVRAVGSIAWKLALVAAGDLAATVSRGPKHEWDVCAGALLIAEAGGRAAEALGEPLLFNRARPKVSGILAGAPAAFARLLEEVRAVGMSDRMREG